ncbi:hypothetical protein [Paenibacillus sp. Soil724D2]|uniref:hypothetical protein n=1 Tax=Paenibacillus sp. (strain Soil724D2) TaxID=1736392 RepID=UPI000AE6F7C8|nr:hypothetical protein [Paenibacillus sp. Soil724D2]
MKNIPLLTNRKKVHKDAAFFEVCIEILQDEGYHNWIELRKKLHEILDELERSADE